MINLSHSAHVHFSGTILSNPTALADIAADRCSYNAAVETFAREASPAAIGEAVAAARRYGFALTAADARQAAVDGLREGLAALGYSEGEIQWHAARRGRRDRHLYVA
ncbi:hypothetical protein ACQR1I_35435 [Bradyrhizobium sp. HKCCYLS2038]|uniref:hypothetical protein n=1 Tax=unclassified Bradyrhizobium TaxID=2631580 RepID=UPI003EB7E649